MTKLKQITTMKSNFIKAFLIVLLLGGMGVGEVGAQASLSVKASNYSIPPLYYLWNNAPDVPVGGSVSSVTDPATACGGRPCGWTKGLEASLAEINYAAKLVNTVNGATISNNASIPTGTKFRVERVQSYTDIAWAGTGFTNDSPYGNWSPGAGPSSVGCTDWNYLNDAQLNVNIQGGFPDFRIFRVHSLLNVAQPSVGVAAVSGPVTCSGNECTVTGAGQIRVKMDFGSTYGRFYYRYDTRGFGVFPTGTAIDSRYSYLFTGSNPPPGQVIGVTAAVRCSANNVPMTSSGGGGPAYNVNFPARSVEFNLTGTAAAQVNNASCVAVSAPSTVTASQPFIGTIKTRNTGNTTWNSASAYSLKRVGSPDWGPDYLNLTGNIGPNSEFQFGSFGFVAPATPGTYDFSWRMSVWGFEFGPTCSQKITVTGPPPTNGSCGSANGWSGSVSFPADANLCSAGTIVAKNTGVSSYTWQCQGLNGGAPASCGTLKLAGSCTAPPTNASFWDTEEQTNVPQVNYPSNFANPDTPARKCEFRCDLGHTWNSSACVPDSVPVNGQCGFAHGKTYESFPSELCSVGNPSAQTTLTNSFTWSCLSSNSGTTASCSATRAAAPPPTNPDLTVDIIEITPSPVKANDLYDVNVEMRIINLDSSNQVQQNRNIPYRAYPQGVSDTTKWGTIGYYNQIITAGGVSNSVSSSITDLAPGLHSICARVNLPQSSLFPETNIVNNDTQNTGNCKTISLGGTLLAPELSITTDKKIIRRGETTNVIWYITTSDELECNVTGPGVDEDFTVPPASTDYNGDHPTGQLTSSSQYVLRCSATDGTAYPPVTATVEVLPSPEEN